MIATFARRYLQAHGIARKARIERMAAQALFDALWDAGFRPRPGPRRDEKSTPDRA